MNDDLSLRIDNPYSVGSVLTFDEGDSLLKREPIQYVKSQRDRYYTVVEGDTIDAIAYEAYGNSKWWWVIADANKIDFGFELEEGTSLLIPDLEKVKATNL
jgi:nucleoid-associated protein YgaU